MYLSFPLHFSALLLSRNVVRLLFACLLLSRCASRGLVVLIVLTALSVYKPRGMTRYGWRKQQELNKGVSAVDASTDKAQGILHELEDNGVHAASFK